MPRLSQRHRLIITALRELGGEATIRAIARKAGLNTNGVSQSLSCDGLYDHVVLVSGSRGSAVWKLKSHANA